MEGFKNIDKTAKTAKRKIPETKSVTSSSKFDPTKLEKPVAKSDSKEKTIPIKTSNRNKTKKPPLDCSLRVTYETRIKTNILKRVIEADSQEAVLKQALDLLVEALPEEERNRFENSLELELE